MALIIAKELGIDNFDERNLKCCCPFHEEKTPSFIWNKKTGRFHCFGACGQSYDIIDVFMKMGMTYIEALQKLFEYADMKVPFGEHHAKTEYNYRYPHEEPLNDKEQVYAYLAKRKISKETADYLDIRQDRRGNCVLNYYDTNDTLTMVKYRPSHRVVKGEAKNWVQKDSDSKPLLFNMNRINIDKPLLITSGELDCAAAIEAGWLNAVSIPLGDQNTHWVETCWEWLEQFKEIIICPDNDESGTKYCKGIVPRLGSWRTKVAVVPADCKDVNECLYRHGKDATLHMIIDAKDTPVDSVVDYADVQNVDWNAIDGITTGIAGLDKHLMRLFEGTLTIVTGVNGCVDYETEFFNGNEWKSIAAYQDGDLVLQYEPDGTATLVQPSQYHKYPCEEFWHIHSTYGVEQMVSDEHNLVYRTSKGHVFKAPFAHVKALHDRSQHGFSGEFITTFSFNGVGLPLTDEELRVMCAVIADGHFQARKTVTPICRINIKKQRKKDRLEMLLDKAHIPYRKTQYNPKDPQFNTYLFYAPIVTKVYDAMWYRCSQHQLQVICDEILHWDGSFGRGNRRSFFTIEKQSADFVQFAFSACGCRATIRAADRPGYRHTEYEVHITNAIKPTIKNTRKKIEIPRVKTGDGFKYCFTVPSGMLVLRRKGRINITGNSGKSSFLSQISCHAMDEGKNVFLYSGELPTFQTKNWIDSIFAGQRNLQQRTSGQSTYYTVTSEARAKINDHYRGMLYLYKDGYSNKMSDIQQSMEDCVRKYGCKLLIVDNLTAINLECRDDSKYQKQAEFVQWLIDFAKRFSCCPVLVVHPHKIETMRRLTKMDIQGISALIDLAHRIISLYKVQESDRQGVMNRRGDGYTKPPLQCDVTADVLKDRMFGWEGYSCELFYDRPSRRFFTSLEDLDHRYAWDQKDYGNSPLPYGAPQLDAEREVFGIAS